MANSVIERKVDMDFFLFAGNDFYAGNGQPLKFIVRWFTIFRQVLVHFHVIASQSQ